PASAPAAASTPPLANRLLSAHRLNLTPAAPASLTFRSEQETEAVIWLRAHSTTGDYRSYKVRLTLDGQPLADHAIRFAYVSLGHGGPVVGARLWDPVSRVISQPDQPLGFRVAAGDHTLGLQILDQAPMVVEQAVITNDLGYLPPGRADFLVEPVVAEEGN
ncbi:MAG: hypothetical protein HUU35_15560, partial [Armatimonadetes bacterium]|nr:hypothetical protein [Armatimonadota bacterium]